MGGTQALMKENHKALDNHKTRYIGNRSVQGFVQGGVVQGELHDKLCGLHHQKGGIRAGVICVGRS
jgi:hypothetical protein